MLVDDEPDFVTSTKVLLETHTGARVADYTSPAMALAALPSVNPECLITDMVMPGYSGIELIRLVAQQRPDLPCLILTGNALSPMEIASIQHRQLRDVLFKPISWVDLATAIQKALAPREETATGTEGFYTPVGRWR